MAHGIRSADRVGLSEEVVGEPHVAVWVGAGELRERLPRPRAHLALVHAEHRREIRVALPALEQELEHCLLVRRESHVGKPRDSHSERCRGRAESWWRRSKVRDGGWARRSRVEAPLGSSGWESGAAGLSRGRSGGGPGSARRRLARGRRARARRLPTGSDRCHQGASARPLGLLPGRAAGDLRAAQLGFRRRFSSSWSGVVGRPIDLARGHPRQG